MFHTRVSDDGCGIADKSLIVWRLTRDESSYGVPQKSLHGHGHFVSDVILSSDGQFALSGSWDHTLRLWDLSKYLSFHFESRPNL